MSGGKVDDAEAAHAESDLPLREDAVVIRAAVGHDVAHPSQRDRINVRVPAELKYSRNATHALFTQPAYCQESLLRYGIKKFEITDERIFLNIVLTTGSKSGTVCPFEAFDG